MTDFEVFDKDTVTIRRVPTVTILKARMLSLNRAAFLALDQPRAVELLFDRAQRILGLRSAPMRARHASFVRSPKHGGNGPFLVSAMAYLDHYGIAAPESRRWTAWIEDSTLCVSLDDESERVTSNRVPHETHDLARTVSV